ncbi:MAG: hypothetical protein ABI467_28040 [Kofleriaceae bacterium]
MRAGLRAGLRARVVAVVAVLAGCGSGGGFPIDAVPVSHAPGMFALAWSLDAANAQPETCAQASATTVTVSIVDEASGAQFSAVFACGLATAVTGALFPATYDLAFSLVGATGVVATAPAQRGLTIVAMQTTSVPAIQFVTP